MLAVNNIEVMYNGVMLVLKGVSLSVPDRSVRTLLGANGAGKTTTLKAISGLLGTELGEVTRGNITFDGEGIDNSDPEDIVDKGIVQVMEGRRVFEHLTAEENLLCGLAVVRNRHSAKGNIDRIYSWFPALKSLRHRIAGYLSGGEQQMLVIGRALMSNPKLMLLDEPSLGLAPLIAKEIFAIMKDINIKEGISALLVEQNALMGLSISDWAYVIENGRVVLDGASEVLKNNEDVKEFYLGLSEVGEKKSYKEVKHYKRRKRWLG